MIKTIIIDDERHAINNLERYLNSYDQFHILGSYIDVYKAIDEIKGQSVDLVFLDIDMPKMNGIEAAERILEIDSEIKIVFVTAYSNYAVDAFEVAAIDYVMKPIMKNRLDKTINRIYKSQKEDDGYIVDMKMKILCFGNFEILWEGESLKWRTSKAEEFIAYLVHQKGEFVHKSKILEELWPDKDVKQATKLLHTSVYYVRNAFKNIGLDGAIEYSNKMYKFDIEDFYLDTDIFEKAIKDFEKESSENIQKLKEGIKVYSGDYFEGNDYLWSVGEQGLLRNKYIDALSKISNYYIDQGSSDDAITYLKKITEFNPYDEKNHRKLLTAYINSGDLVSCKKHYKNIENEFKVELGEELSLKTKEIYSSIQGD